MITYYNESWENSPTYIKDNSVDLFFCDPPYFMSGYKNKSADLLTGSRVDWDNQWENNDEFLAWTEEWMKLTYNQMSPTGSGYYCISWQHSGSFQAILTKVGFTVQNRITWKRDKGRGSKTNWKSMHEDVWFVTKHPTNYVFNVEDVKVKKKVIAPYRDENGDPKGWAFDENGEKIRYTYPGNLWQDYTVPFWSMHEVKSYAKTKKTPNNTLTKHNTQKPKDLVKNIILASSNDGDTVVDYFLGSGTSAVASKELNRNFIGFDVNKTCCEMTATRLKNE